MASCTDENISSTIISARKYIPYRNRKKIQDVNQRVRDYVNAHSD
ncbi:MAG: hypothetical protein WA323_06205 [Candidatus Nitrosopolaris sp.]